VYLHQRTILGAYYDLHSCSGHILSFPQYSQGGLLTILLKSFTKIDNENKVTTFAAGKGLKLRMTSH